MSNTLRLLPGESESVTAQHALCYVGVRGLNVEFESSDDFDGISESRLGSVKRVMGLDANTDVIATLRPKAKRSFGRKTTKKAVTEERSEDEPSVKEIPADEDSE